MSAFPFRYIIHIYLCHEPDQSKMMIDRGGILCYYCTPQHFTDIIFTSHPSLIILVEERPHIVVSSEHITSNISMHFTKSVREFATRINQTDDAEVKDDMVSE